MVHLLVASKGIPHAGPYRCSSGPQHKHQVEHCQHLLEGFTGGCRWGYRGYVAPSRASREHDQGAQRCAESTPTFITSFKSFLNPKPCTLNPTT